MALIQMPFLALTRLIQLVVIFIFSIERADGKAWYCDLKSEMGILAN